jgi:hypothetical protein
LKQHDRRATDARDGGAFSDALVGHVSSGAGRAGASRFDGDVTVVVVDSPPLPRAILSG